MGKFGQVGLIESAPNVVARTAVPKHMAVSAHVDVNEKTRRHGRAARLERIFRFFVGDMGHALGRERTFAAMGREGCAHHGSKVHDGLIVEAWALFVELLLRKLGKSAFARGGIYGRGDGKETRENAIYVSVDHGTGLIIGNGANGCRRIVAHPAQAANFVVGFGKAACGNYLLRCRMQVARPAIVAQALPQLHHLVLGGGGKGFDIGKTVYEALIITAPLLHPGLLKDDFGEPHAISTRLVAPRQLPMMECIPRFEFFFNHGTT